MGYWVYMLRCGDGSLYTGCTNDLSRRLRAHQSGRGAKYTRSRLPVELVYREEAADRQYNGVKPLIFGSDISPEAIRLSIRHARRAGVLDSVRFEVKAAADFASRFSEGTIVTNPPYGERVIGRVKADECYKGLGGALKKYPGWSLFLITAARDFEKHFGKKCDREKKIFNSNRECRYYYYYGKKTEKKI